MEARAGAGHQAHSTLSLRWRLNLYLSLMVYLGAERGAIEDRYLLSNNFIDRT